MPVDFEVKKLIEQAWLSRSRMQGLKPGTVKYRRMEVEFFAGAMVALNAVFPNEDPTRLSTAVPPIWTICAMSGRPIVEVAK